MSPEQAEGNTAQVDLRTDIYAVGTILYQMLSSRVPFESSSVPALLYKIVHKQAPPLRSLVPGLPAAVEAVVQKAMAKRPGDRYPDIASFRAAFLEAVEAPVEPAAEPPVPAVDCDVPESTAVEGAKSPAEVTTLMGSTGEHVPSREQPRRRRTGVLLAAGVVLVLGAAGGVVALLPAGGDAPGTRADELPARGLQPVAVSAPDASPVVTAVETEEATADAAAPASKAPAPKITAAAPATGGARRPRRRPRSRMQPEPAGTEIAQPVTQKQPEAPAKTEPPKKPQAPFVGDL
jgi:serine/threonine-protein kinase